MQAACRVFLAAENKANIHIPDCAKAELRLAKSHRKVTTVPFVMVARSTGCCAIAIRPSCSFLIAGILVSD